MTDQAIIGAYRILECIGEGGMGAVFRARHELMGKYAAVKTLLPKFADDAVFVQRFVNEAKAASRIRHPGVVEIFDITRGDDGSVNIVMELLEGEPLRERLNRVGHLSIAETERFVQQIGGALGAVHEAGIVHRDLKPDNLFITIDADIHGGERIKILDFGIAKLAGEDGIAEFLTRTGQVMGTAPYMAPEQWQGANRADHRADLYSLGVHSLRDDMWTSSVRR